MPRSLSLLIAGVLIAACGGPSGSTPTGPVSQASVSAPGSLSPSAPTATATPVRVYVCETAYKPSRVLVACGDGNARVVGLRWSVWTSTHAVGSGTWQQNDCQPDCARGRFHDFPVRLDLDHPMRGQGTVIFGDVTASFPRAAPYGARNGVEPVMRNGAYAP